MNFRHSKGFTIIELLVVIVIIAVLAGIVTLFVTTQGQKARDSRRIADLSEVQKALEFYYSEYGCYPASTGTDTNRSKLPPNDPCPNTLASPPSTNCADVNDWWNTSLQVLVEAKFLPSLPHDPINEGEYPQFLCYSYYHYKSSTDESFKCGGNPAAYYDYALLFSTEKSTPSLPIWMYGPSTGIFDYCYVGKYIGK